MNNEPITEPMTEIIDPPIESDKALIGTNETDIEPVSFSIEDATEHLEKETPKKTTRSGRSVPLLLRLSCWTA